MTRTFRPDPNVTGWRKSSHSNQEGGNCVEVADGVPGLAPVRDSKDANGHVLTFRTGAWATFIGALKTARPLG
ncbi:DUF397 domain-containing protein [Streptomyces sp. bgisy022]|uniref:DUF397 domain-containing protein n=1 Tax=Streptomyces sp. bgisy022 TaxID=3413769 RepID=UPI003D74427E